MGGFTLHELLPKLKVRVTALHQQGDRLYLGTANGSLQVYSFDFPAESTSHPVPQLKHLKTHALGKRPIDQIDTLQESNQLIVLSDTVVSLYSLPDLGKPTVLSAARYAHAFAVTSYTPASKVSKTQNGTASGDAEGVAKVPIRRDLIVIGCRKKVLVYGAAKTMRDPWELSLPHSPRTVIFPSASSQTNPLPSLIHLLYSPTQSVLLHLNPSSSQRLSVSELNNAPPPSALGKNADNTPASGLTENSSGAGSGLGMGMGALTGLGGYVGLGGKAVIPAGTRTVGGEVVLAREDLGVFYSSEGNYTRDQSLRWSGPPESLGFSNPFIYSVVPLFPAGAGNNTAPTPLLQVHLAPTLAFRDVITFPPPSLGMSSVSSLSVVAQQATTPASLASAATRVLLVTTPSDKTLSTNEGSSIWALETADIGEQIDDLVREGQILDAIGLAEAVGETALSPTRRLKHLKTLYAVQQFAKGQYQTAIETFLVFNVNPALVIALYPANSISGKSFVPRDRWMEVFGAVEDAKLEPEDTASTREDATSKGLLRRVAHMGLSKKGSTETLRAATIAQGQDTSDAASMASTEKVSSSPVIDETVIPRQALEALMYFLSDRRQKLTGAISALSNPLPAESTIPPLSSLSGEDLHEIPSIPMTEYDPTQLLRVAQVIYTALIKVYLVARPVLVGSLCRLENWCDVEEVEELLKEKKKFSDLIDLYQGKKMHAKALAMLHELAKDEEDKLDRYPPTVRYLQKLGPGELPLIFESSRWMFKEDPKMALQIFTADEPEVEALPRKEVLAFLEKENADACRGYLEHIITDLHEDGAHFHDKLAEIYVEKAKGALRTDSNPKPEAYDVLLQFLNSSSRYRSYRLLPKLKDDKMPEAKAVLLGRLGKHEEALRLYVFDLKDYTAAETYCARVYLRDPDPKGIFLLLLRIYLHPPTSKDKMLLEPGLSLISTHGTRLDAKEVLDLLPPLVTMEDVRAFFIKTLRGAMAKKNDSRIVKGLIASRKEEVERVLMASQVKRVRVTDQRICPQCQKRLGTSAIAVHSPRGEVTHLHCKDIFSARLAKLRE